MPIYVYQCETCGLTFERRQHMTEPSLEDCPECDGRVHRVIQPVGIVFKGSGFYVTDNRSKSATALPGKKESDSGSSSQSNGSGSSSSSTASTAEKKPESSKSTGGTD
jgi:putative FmdB family regulatory protein